MGRYGLDSFGSEEAQLRMSNVILLNWASISILTLVLILR
jgi:hypothetical protein